MNHADPMQVMLVEDAVPVRHRLREMISETGGMRVAAEAATAADAISAFDTIHPEAVMLDLALPDGSGLDVLRHIREGGSSCPVSSLTSTPPVGVIVTSAGVSAPPPSTARVASSTAHSSRVMATASNHARGVFHRSSDARSAPRRFMVARG